MSSGPVATRRAACALIAFGALALDAPPAPAQGAPSWAVRCDARGCSASRALSEIATLQRVATVSVLTEAGAPGATLAAALPLGLALEPGVQFVLGETVWPAPFKVCFPDGCSAAATLDAAMLATLVAAPDLEVRYFTFNDGRALSITAPLDGLAAALDGARP